MYLTTGEYGASTRSWYIFEWPPAEVVTAASHAIALLTPLRRSSDCKTPDSKSAYPLHRENPYSISSTPLHLSSLLARDDSALEGHRSTRIHVVSKVQRILRALHYIVKPGLNLAGGVISLPSPSTGLRMSNDATMFAKASQRA